MKGFRLQCRLGGEGLRIQGGRSGDAWTLFLLRFVPTFNGQNNLENATRNTLNLKTSQ